MPIIKRWTPQVEQTQIPHPQPVPQNWIGAQNVSRSMESVVRTVAGMQSKEHADEAKSILAGSTAKLGEIRLQMETEVDEVKGEAALKKDLYTDYSTRFAEKAMEIRDELPSHLQAEFDQHYAAQEGGFHRALRGHIAKQADAYSDVQHKAELTNAGNIAARSAVATIQEGGAVTSNPDLDAQRERVAKEADRVNARRGWTGEAADASKRLVLSAYHLGVAEAIIGSDAPGKAAAAKAYLAKYSNEIDAEALAKSKVDDQIAAASLADKARSEEERIWAEAKGNPVKAGELVRAIKDTPLSDAVDKRLSARIQENDTRRKAAEKDPVARIENDWLTGGTFDPNTDQRFKRLSPEGQNLVLTRWNTYQRTLKSEEHSDRQKQNQADNDALWHFRGGIPYAGKPGEDRLTIDIDSTDDPIIQNASKPMRDRLKKEQEDLRVEHQKNQGMPLTLVQKEAAKLGKAMGWDDAKVKQFQGFIAGSYAEWSGSEDAKGKQVPNRQDVYKMLKSALDYGDSADWLPHGLVKNKYRFEDPSIKTADFATQPGHQKLDETFKPEGDLPPIQKAPAKAGGIDPADRERANAAMRAKYPGAKPLSDAQVRAWLDAQKGAK